MDEEQSNSRRSFIKTGLITGAIAAGGLGIMEVASQDTSKKKGDTVKLLSPDGKIVEVDSSEINPQIPDSLISTHNVREGVPGKKFVMVIDLAKCKNAGRCKSACSKMHYLPETRSYIKINKMQDSDKASPYWMPTPCFHCDNPPCVKVCPVGATFKLTDGIVGIDNDRCIGCRFCMVACPYSARVFNWDTEYQINVVRFKEIKEHAACSTHVTGTVEKCDFCPTKAAKNELPDCVQACPNGVFYFGDENEDVVSNGDETVRLSQLLKDKSGYRFLEDLGTKPRVYYLPPVDRQFPFKDVEPGTT
ncbi:4Fe-4S dicluster domain-containing protein [Danxiaibacter flavus]|uniref:4Fe-4S dicluster domain-containing protein n=2 Tax=Danxiaibacter flavus TaxID=3049108 RepID=A0ABV3ZG74_9BACT